MHTNINDFNWLAEGNGQLAMEKLVKDFAYCVPKPRAPIASIPPQSVDSLGQTVYII